MILLEVYGSDRSNQVPWKKLRQLDNWIQDFVESSSDSADVKGLFLINHARKQSIPERKELNVEANESKYAEKRNITIMTTWQLFRLLVLKLDHNEFDIESFESTVKDAVGLIKDDEIGLWNIDQNWIPIIRFRLK